MSSISDPIVSLKAPFGVFVVVVQYLLDEGDGFVCVAIESFHPRTSPNIFGQILMQNQLIIWDRANNQLGVMPTNCLTGKPL